MLVRVHAASVHADVWHMVRGFPFLLYGIIGRGLQQPAHPSPGTDMAGVVVRAGEGRRPAGSSRATRSSARSSPGCSGATAAFAEYVRPPPSPRWSPSRRRCPSSRPRPSRLLGPDRALQPAPRPEPQPGDRVLVDGAAQQRSACSSSQLAKVTAALGRDCRRRRPAGGAARTRRRRGHRLFGSGSAQGSDPVQRRHRHLPRRPPVLPSEARPHAARPVRADRARPVPGRRAGAGWGACPR